MKGIFNRLLMRMGISLATCLVVLLLAARLRVGIPVADSHRANGPLPSLPVGPVQEGVTVRQEFVARGERIRSVELQLATYARRNAGFVVLRVFRRGAGTWQEIGARTLRKAHLVDGAYQLFGFAPALTVEKGERLALTLTADGDSANAITWWMAPKWNEPGGQLFINDQLQDGIAQFDVDYSPLVGRLGGPRLRGRLWRRLTAFLDPPGQVMLVVGFLLAMVALIHMLIWSGTEATERRK